jgi:hypothetical protein
MNGDGVSTDHYYMITPLVVLLVSWVDPHLVNQEPVLVLSWTQD